MSNPVLVTVVTVCRNVKSSLEKTMNSLLHQSYAHIDYVIIDGASTDGTPEMLGKTEGIRWISEPDKGIYDAMNKGIRMAEGEWVIFMNAGDVFASDDTLSKVFSVEYAIRGGWDNPSVTKLERVEREPQNPEPDP